MRIALWQVLVRRPAGQLCVTGEAGARMVGRGSGQITGSAKEFSFQGELCWMNLQLVFWKVF